SSSADFDAHLKDLCTTLDATIAFDPVAGEMTGRLLAAMPKGSVAVVYGSLSDAACSIRPERFIYERKRVEGFWLGVWAEKIGLLGRMRVAMGLQKFLATDLQTEVRARVTLEQVPEAIETYKHDMTGGKVLILPDGDTKDFS
ncbi:MAG: zinc-binding dehydrogenase, partial [Planctomycetota bacterium]|nr:zinc-binding dehydrogenase [Planctomycetota bacterium]